MEAGFDIYGDVIARDFLPLIYSPVSLTTQNPALEPIILVMQKALDAGATHDLNKLYNKGHREYMRQKLSSSLTAEEKEYIKNNPQVKFVAEYYNYPLSFYNTHDNEWQGIVFDLLYEIGELTGISFKLVNDRFTEWPILLEMVEARTAELVKQQEETNALAHWYKSILDATPLPITVTDENMNCTFVNSTVENFLNIKREDMYGKPCSYGTQIYATPSPAVLPARNAG